MSDVDRMGAVADEDRLPWLEAVEDEDRRGGAGAGALVAALIAALVALGLVVGGVFWLRDRGRDQGAGGEGEMIAAPAGPYKQKPENPGGMKVEGAGDAAYAASTGAQVNSSVDIAALPEAPIVGPGSKSAEEGEGAKPAPAAPAPAKQAASSPKQGEQLAAAKPEPKAAEKAVAEKPAAGGTIQLGAFSSAEKANAAWKTMSGRFAYLKPLTSSVTPVASGGHTLYRLRVAAGGEAKTVCAKLKVAGETCTVIG